MIHRHLNSERGSIDETIGKLDAQQIWWKRNREEKEKVGSDDRCNARRKKSESMGSTSRFGQLVRLLETHTEIA